MPGGDPKSLVAALSKNITETVMIKTHVACSSGKHIAFMRNHVVHQCGSSGHLTLLPAYKEAAAQYPNGERR
jgi:hypothetical protein